MSFYFEFHPEAFLILPLLGIAHGECEDPNCQAEHWKITLGWFLWDASLVFEFGGGDAA